LQTSFAKITTRTATSTTLLPKGIQNTFIGTAAAKRGSVIRYETWEDGTIAALREGEDGNRWYEKICDKNGNFSF
jgi:hypothetical protein